MGTAPPDVKEGLHPGIAELRISAAKKKLPLLGSEEQQLAFCLPLWY
jgi:hypothetical protein